MSAEQEVREGDERLVFDPEEWGGKDVGDNSQFWHRATLMNVRRDRDGRELIADVLFHHDGRVGRGHFVNCMEVLASC